jgi:TRAP-type mannitol/chloroaromatic compound transport system permease large subunit
MLAFVCLQVVGLALVFFFPAVALWLPDLLFG